jgi:DnaJ-class molecular chaperone
VASDSGDSDGQAREAHEPRECMACRGSGRVISNLGGELSELACPWCAGSGVRVTGIDAQAAWIERQGADAGAA